MSSIPNSAMPYARTQNQSRSGRRQQMRAALSNGRRWAGDTYRTASSSARRHPGMAASALAATVIAGLAAVFAPRMLRGNRMFAR